METLFSWIHLSDIHVGHGGAQHANDQRLILRALTTDISEQTKTRALDPDAVLLTGDIGFSGGARVRPGEAQSSEYSQARDWLIDIASTVGVPLDAVFLVPGNHDVARTTGGIPAYVVRGLRQGDQELDAALAEAETREILRARFKHYLDFCTQINPRCAELDGWAFQRNGRDGLDVRLVGLNSALLCNDDQDRGKLRLGKRQLQLLADPSRQSNELVVVLSHHPLNDGWLRDEQDAQRWVENHAHIHLSGHVHEPDSWRVRRGGTRHSHIRVVAGAVHEESKPREVPYSHGYNLGAVIRNEHDSLELRIWPRRWSAKKMGFVQDTEGIDEPSPCAVHDLGLRLPRPSTPPGGACPPAPRALVPRDLTLDAAEDAYRTAVIDRFSRLPIRMRSVDPVELPLEAVYVDLKVVADVPPGADMFSADERRLLADLGSVEGDERLEKQRQLDELRYGRWRRADAPRSSAPQSILERTARASRPVVVLGDPGSGKSTLLHLMALRAAQQGRLLPGEPAPDGGRLLPIFVPLAAYDEHHSHNNPHLPIEEFLAVYWRVWQAQPDRREVFLRALREGRALVLLDGLDEVLTSARRAYVARQVEAFLRMWAAPGNRVVITSRVIGYREAPLSGDVDHVTMIDFGPREIDSFLTCWCEALEGWAARGLTPSGRERAMKEKKALLAEITRAPYLGRFAGNPLTLSMLAVLHRQGGRLPSRRAELYREFTAMLMELRPELRSEGVRKDPVERFDVPTVRAHLTDLGLWLQQHRPSNTASGDDLTRALTQSFLRVDASDAASPTPKEQLEAERRSRKLLEELRLVTGLIAARGHDAYGFLHLTYQEFFAAGALARTTPEERWRVLRPNLHHPRWREVILLCAGWLGVLSDDAAQVGDLIRRVLRAGSDHESLLHRDALLAAAIAAEDVRAPRPVLDEVHAALDALRDDAIFAVQQKALDGIASLARLGYEPSIDYLLRRLETSPDAHHPFAGSCHAAVRAVLGAPSSKRLLDALVRIAFDHVDTSARFAALHSINDSLRTDPVLRGRAVRAMLDAGDEHLGLHTVLEPLLDECDDVRQAFISQLSGPQYRQPAISALARKIQHIPDATQLLEPYWDDETDPHIRSAMLPAAAEWARKDQHWRSRLIECVNDRRHNVRRESITALGPLASDFLDARDALAKCLADRDPSMAQAALHALAPVARFDDEIRNTMVLMLDSRDQAVRSSTVFALGFSVPFHPELSEPLARHLADHDEQVRRSAMSALAPAAGENLALRELFKQRLSDIDTCPLSVRIETIAPMTLIDPVVRAEVIECLNDADPRARSASLAALAPLAPEDSALASLMTQRLEDNDPRTRAAAVKALAAAVPRNAAVRDAILHVAGAGAAHCKDPAAAWLASAATDALAPVARDPVVRPVLLRLFESGAAQARLAAARSLLPLLTEHIDIREQFRSMATAVAASEYHVSETIGAILADAAEHDDYILSQLLKISTRSLPHRWATELIIRHIPSLDVRSLLMSLKDSRYIDSHDLIARLMPWYDTDHSVRRYVIDCFEGTDRRVTLGHTQYPESLSDRIKIDADLRRAIIAIAAGARETLPHVSTREPLDAMHFLLPHAASLPDVERLFRETLARPSSFSHTFDHARRFLAAAGLSARVDRDAMLRIDLVPWLGARTDSSDPTVKDARRTMARNIAPFAGETPAIRDRLMAMLDSVAWQDRQGAAWTLLFAPGDRPPELIHRMRGLLHDRRAEESLSERLEAAKVFLNHVELDLSRRAVEVTKQALAYGKDPWCEPLGSQVRREAAAVLGTLDPAYGDPELVCQVRQALAEESLADVRDALYHALVRLAVATEIPQA